MEEVLAGGYESLVAGHWSDSRAAFQDALDLTGARVAAKADAGEVLVSSTVKDLVAGSGLMFEDRGAHELSGIPGEWHLYSVVDSGHRKTLGRG